MNMISASFLMIHIIVTSINGELYSALAGMETLLLTQETIIDSIEDYIESSEKRIKEMKSLKENYKQLYEASRQNFQEFVSNPINAFVLIKKLSIDWSEAKRSMSCPFTTGLIPINVIYPDHNDLSGAAKALLRVQQTYSLDTETLVQGKIEGAPDGLPLSADDCFELGRQAMYAAQYDSAISWLELASERCIKDNTTDLKNCSDVLKYIHISNIEVEKSELMMLTNSLLSLGFMSVSKSLDGSGASQENSMEEATSNNMFTGHTNMFDEIVYKTLCKRSISAISAIYSTNLRCKLISPHPYMLLQPVKEEQLSVEPKISLFYDVISDKEIEIMKALALPELVRAEVAEYSGGLGHRVSDTRVTKIAWLREEDHPVIPKMYHRIEDITGLSSSTAEPFQMANYGLGGHFHLHMDVLPDTESYFGPDMGNRIATWLTYLSDVHGGGATVFPRLNITVWPKKGSALFWHNVKSNGVGNILTLHGACPVVMGSKWVTNVWFHERGQEFRLKCGTHPEAALKRSYSFKT